MMQSITNTTPPPEDIQEHEMHKKLFLIKSKHAFKNYKNHDYFESRRNQSYSMHQPKNRQFVETPTPYGINNAYRYICTEASKLILQKSQNKMYKSKNQSIKTEFDREIPKQTINYGAKPRSTYLLPNLSSESRKMEHLNSIQVHNISKTFLFPKVEDNVIFILYDKDSPQKIGSFTLKFNIFPYVLNTFLKSKINYHQMNQEQYTYLKSMIIMIESTKKEYVQYKDMVNIKSIKQLFLQLQSDHQSVYKQQMIRYFFIANSTAYEYQLNKIKDQIKRMIEFQFNKDISSNELFIFDTQNGSQVLDLFQLMKGSGKYVFGFEKDIITLYCKHVKQKQAHEKMASQIRRWKNVAPKDQFQGQKPRCMTSDKYHKLFDTVQKKRKGITVRRKPISSLKTQQFIDRDKLFKDSSIFQ